MFIEIFDVTILDECLEDNLPVFLMWELVTSHNRMSHDAKPHDQSPMCEYISIMD